MGKRILNVLFSSNFSWRTSIIFAGPLVPLLRTSGDDVLGYPYLSASPPVRNVIVRSISGATPADLLMASMVAETYWPLRPVYRDKGTPQKKGGGPVLLLQNYLHPLSLRSRGPYLFPTPLNT